MTNNDPPRSGEAVPRPEWAAHTARSSREASANAAALGWEKAATIIKGNTITDVAGNGFQTEPQTVREQPVPTPVRTEVLEAAERAVNGDRDQEYGAPAVNLNNIAEMWTIQLGPKLRPGVRITAGEVAALNVGAKLCRSIKTPGKRDHWVDAAGYAALAAELNEDPQ